MIIPPLVTTIGGYAIFSGFWWILQRKLLTAGVPKSIVLFVSGVSAGALLIASLVLYGLPVFSPQLVIFIVINILLNSLIAFCYATAVAKGEVSLAVSVTAFAPVLAIAVAFLFFHEVPRPGAMIGIFIVLLGTYVMNINPARHGGLLGPVHQIWAERSIWLKYAVGAAVAAGFTIPFARHIIQQTNYLFDPGMELFFGWGVFWGVSALMRREYNFRSKFSAGKIIIIALIMGACFAIANAFQGAAYLYGVAASVGALKRLDGPVTVILASLFLHEKGTKYRLIGTLIIAVGAFLIVTLK